MPDALPRGSEDFSIADADVVNRVLAGETDLFEVIMRRHNQRLYRAARAILRDEAEAEQVMQQTYFLAYTHLKQFAGKSKFSTWLTKIAVHEALARLRQRSRFVDVESFAESEKGNQMLRSTEGSPEQMALNHESSRRNRFGPHSRARKNNSVKGKPRPGTQALFQTDRSWIPWLWVPLYFLG